MTQPKFDNLEVPGEGGVPAFGLYHDPISDHRDVKSGSTLVELLMKDTWDETVRDGEHGPMAIVVSKDQVSFLHFNPVLQSDEGGVDFMHKMLKKAGSDSDTVGIAFLAMGKYAPLPDGISEEEAIKIAQETDHLQDIISYHAEWKGEEPTMRVVFVRKDKHGRVESYDEGLNEDGSLAGNTIKSGRFYDLMGQENG